MDLVSDGSETAAPALSRGSVRWSALAIIGRQVSQITCALVLARLLGPSTYGVISAATVYVTLTTLVLDQGLAAAVVQRPRLEARTAGAVATANLVTGVVLAAGTWLLAPLVADFFRADRLTELLRVLGLGLLLKAVAITPRALQLRRLGFRTLALADIVGGVSGAVLGIGAAVLGADIWSLAWQVLATDLVIGAVLVAATRDCRPNLQLRRLGEVLPFSVRILGSNSLAFLSRNSDNILVGRFLGVTSLSLYSMAYRVLVIPVQLIGQTVNRVAFPTLARLTGDAQRLASTTRMITEMLATAAIPPMVLAAVASSELIRVVLGPDWSAASTVLSVLALAGARETALQGTHSLMRAMGRGRLILRYEIGAACVQLTGIVIGLQFGVLGVAIGFTLAGFVLTPVLMAIQKRLAGLPYRVQLGALAPGMHCSLWGALAYLAVELADWSALPTLVVGSLTFAVVSLLVLRLAHARTWASVIGSRFRVGSEEGSSA